MSDNEAPKWSGVVDLLSPESQVHYSNGRLCGRQKEVVALGSRWARWLSRTGLCGRSKSRSAAADFGRPKSRPAAWWVTQAVSLFRAGGSESAPSSSEPQGSLLRLRPFVALATALPSTESVSTCNLVLLAPTSRTSPSSRSRYP